MRRLSRKKAWSILSSHSIVILGHGGATIKETKEVIKNTVELVPDVIESMIEKVASTQRSTLIKQLSGMMAMN